MVKAFLELLHNQIHYNNQKILLIRDYYRTDQTPCLTVTQADEMFIKRKYVEINNKQYLRKQHRVDLWIDIWCNTEDERESIMRQVNKRILEAESNHYTTCAHYNKADGFCNNLEKPCEALNSHNGRASKKQCPYPKKYGYISFFTKNHILKSTFHINSITNLDELDITQPIRRTIFKLEMEYYTYHRIGGIVFDDIIINEELL